MCMFNTCIIYYFYVDSILVYNISCNDTYLAFFWILIFNLVLVISSNFFSFFHFIKNILIIYLAIYDWVIIIIIIISEDI
jgi:hypothetical protein